MMFLFPVLDLVICDWSISWKKKKKKKKKTQLFIIFDLFSPSLLTSITVGRNLSFKGLAIK